MSDAEYYGAARIRSRPQLNLAEWQMREACNHWLNVARHRSYLWRWLRTWDEVEYLEAVENSTLKPKVKKTMAATAATATPEGITKVSRQVIANEVGCRKLDTITAHWKAGEAAGLMASKRRFNSSKLIQLTLEPGDHEWIDGDVSRIEIEHGPHDPAF